MSVAISHHKVILQAEKLQHASVLTPGAELRERTFQHHIPMETKRIGNGRQPVGQFLS
jgi:hypothetical protein